MKWPMNSLNTNICHLQCTACCWKSSLQPEHTLLAKVIRWKQNQNHIGKVSDGAGQWLWYLIQNIQKSILSFEIFLWLSAIERDVENFDICKFFAMLVQRRKWFEIQVNCYKLIYGSVWTSCWSFTHISMSKLRAPFLLVSWRGWKHHKIYLKIYIRYNG